MTLATSERLLTATASPLRARESLPRPAMADLRRRMAIDHCKWDPQVGDQSTLADFPLVLNADDWRQLRQWAEALASEAIAAERELLVSMESRRPLALSRRLSRALQRTNGAATDWPRLMRFDFHWTTDGWRISELNADVPGGLCEASAFTTMMSSATSAGESPGDPAGDWAETVAQLITDGPPNVALLTAPGYMEDHQVMAYLAGRLAEHGIAAQLGRPENLRWLSGRPSFAGLGQAGEIGAVVRFFQAEWLTRLRGSSGWQNYFANRAVPVLNDATSLLIESKRFPLTWDRLATLLPTWRALLPETRDPRAVDRRDRDAWIFKTAFCNTGDSVSAADWLDARAWRTARRQIFWQPSQWIAQRRFRVVPIDSPAGPIYPCIGVYTVAGHAAGIYGRFSTGPVINFTAADVAVLIAGDV